MRQPAAAAGPIDEQVLRFAATRDPADRAAAIEAGMPLAASLARRYRNRGEDLADLEQVALLGLVHAVDRFDPAFGRPFAAFAVATILGELKRHLRDKTWPVHVPRTMKETGRIVSSAIDSLEHMNRAVTVEALASETGLSPEEVLDGIEASQARRAVSLDSPPPGAPEEASSLAEWLPADDGSDIALDMAALRPTLESLGERDRQILHLRFDCGLSQSEIGACLGMSQMHVSRLLRSLFVRLRAELAET